MKNGIKKDKNNNVQLTMNFEENKNKELNLIKEKLAKLDLMNITPIDALNYLYELKEELKKEENN